MRSREEHVCERVIVLLDFPTERLSISNAKRFDLAERWHVESCLVVGVEASLVARALGSFDFRFELFAESVERTDAHDADAEPNAEDGRNVDDELVQRQRLAVIEREEWFSRRLHEERERSVVALVVVS